MASLDSTGSPCSLAQVDFPEAGKPTRTIIEERINEPRLIHHEPTPSRGRRPSCASAQDLPFTAWCDGKVVARRADVLREQARVHDVRGQPPQRRSHRSMA